MIAPLDGKRGFCFAAGPARVSGESAPAKHIPGNDDAAKIVRHRPGRAQLSARFEVYSGSAKSIQTHARVQSGDRPATETAGNLARFVLLPGQRHDSIGVEPLIAGVSFDALIGDKAFDSDHLRAELADRRALAVIPPKSNRASTIPCDAAMYAWRHLVENFFCDLKGFRRIATRYDKRARHFLAAIHLAAVVIWLN